jgi:glucose-1-phosphate adenylyltransferase
MSADRPYLASMGIYLFEREVLAESLVTPHDDFGRDLLPAAVGRVRVQAHFFSGYWRDIGTIRAFYDAHMDMLRPDPPFTFLDPDWPIYTRPRYLPGSRVTGAAIDRCVLADGAIIANSELVDSIVGVRSRIRHAKVRRSLIMGADEYCPDAGADAPPVGIGEGSVVENAIIDKNVRIGRDVRLVNEDGVEEADGDGWVIRSGITVVSKNAVIPDGTRV